MSVVSRGQILVILGMVIITAGLWMAPTQASEKKKENDRPQDTEALNKVARAVEILEEGKGAPMEGIKLLREALKENPKDEEAIFYLGYFSVQSGQYEKAVTRFVSLLEINPSRQDARYLLGMSHLELKDTVGALSQLRIVANKSTEEELKENALRAINELEKL